jgi:VWFA-related protein
MAQVFSIGDPGFQVVQNCHLATISNAIPAMLANVLAPCLPVTTMGSPRDSHSFRMHWLRGSCLLLLLCGVLNLRAAQQTAPTSSANSSTQGQSGEMSVKEETSTSAADSEAAKFRVNVKLVLARVVVRDSTGHAVGNLKKEDFEVFDNGKKQVISNFDAEHLPAPPILPTTPVTASGGTTNTTSTPPTFPSRYVAYVFDDLRLNFGDLAHVREAAQRRIAELPASDRAAIFSTSGQTVLDFTDDRAELQKTLENLRPRPTQVQSGTQCPDISVYMADLIVNKHDPNALQTAINDYVICAHLLPQQVAAAGPTVEGFATQVLNIGEEESRMGLRVLKDVVRRMTVMPGQRTLVLVSPGFLTPELEYNYNELIDTALRGQVVISSLDARGLYVVLPFGDASQPGRPDVDLPGQANMATMRVSLDTQSALAESDILAVLANSTGGSFFQNNNDMNEGFRRVADAPEFWYVVGFAPQNLKNDGKFHTLKVTLANHQKYDLQARRGYYAPRKAEDPAEEAKREVEDEVFSSEELHELPVVLHTEFFKPADDSAKLTVLARIDVKRLHYKQAQDRNQNDLTVVTAVFDRNGNFLQANQKTVQMRWKSETLQAKLSSGITLKSSFDVKPGRYMVRVVARDSEQQVMSAENGAVEIP